LARKRRQSHQPVHVLAVDDSGLAQVQHLVTDGDADAPPPVFRRLKRPKGKFWIGKSASAPFALSTQLSSEGSLVASVAMFMAASGRNVS
jgi:hypothetical protein